MTASASRPILLFPLSLLAGSTGFFAAWTIVSNIASLGGLPFFTLYIALLAACFGAWAGIRSAPAIRHSILGSTSGFDPTPVTGWKWLIPSGARDVALLLVIGIAMSAGLGFFVVGSMYWPLWAGAASSVALVWFAGSRRATKQVPTYPDQPGRSDVIWFMVLCVTLLLAYFFLLNADGDDAFYLNLPIGILADRHAIMSHDTMFGAGEWPLLMPTYRAESLPTLTAMIASVPGISARTAAHTILPAVWCVNLAAALHVIGSWLFGRYWMVFASLSLAILFALDGSLLSYASHGLVRFFHGKGPLIAIIVPMITLFAFLSARKPEWPSLAALAALQICAVGFTANGIYVAPLALGLPVASVFLSSRHRMHWRSAIPLACAVYPVAIGLYLILTMPPSAVDVTSSPSIVRDLWAQFPASYVLALILVAISLAIYLGGIRRLSIVVPIHIGLALLLVFNPLLWDAYSRHVTGNLNYRLFWVVPLPSLVAGLLTLFWIHGGKAGRMAAAVLASGLLAGPASVLRPTNGTSLAFSAVKIDPPVIAAVRRINGVTPLGTRVLAAEELSEWIPTEEGYRYPVVVRDSYLDILLDRVDVVDVGRRRQLLQWISGNPDSLSADQLAALVSDLCVGTVVVDLNSPARGRLQAMIRDLQGQLVATEGAYEIFLLRKSAAGCPASTQSANARS